MEINSLSDFINFASNVLNQDSSKQLFYRGHSSKDYKLHPSLYRKEKYYLSEDKIFKEAIINCPHEFYNCKTTLEILVKMQHYGIPTRILDLTKNALVALFIACYKNNEMDGEIVLLQIPEDHVCYFDSDRISILTNIAKQKPDFAFGYKGDFDYNNPEDVSEVNERCFSYLLHSIKEDKTQFYDIINPKHLENVFAVHAKLDNPRIIRQSGAFLVFGINKDKSRCAEVNPNWILQPGNERVIIPKTLKNKWIDF